MIAEIRNIHAEYLQEEAAYRKKQSELLNEFTKATRNLVRKRTTLISDLFLSIDPRKKYFTQGDNTATFPGGSITWSRSKLAVDFNEKKEQELIGKLENKGYADVIDTEKVINRTNLKKHWRQIRKHGKGRKRPRTLGVRGFRFYYTHRIHLLLPDLLAERDVQFTAVLKNERAS